MTENWQHRIKNFEQTPPQGVWESIAGKLDAENNLQSRLLDYEEAPPAFVWENINSQLSDEKQEAKIIPMHSNKNRKAVWGIAAAASVTAVVLLSVFYFNNKKTVANTSIAANTEVKKDAGNNANLQNAPETTSKQEPVLIAETKQTKTQRSATKRITKAETPEQEINVDYVKADEATPLAGPPELDQNKKLQNEQGEETNDIAMLNSPNSYITITGPNGDQVKVSSKFANAINYINDKMPSSEEYIDKVIKEGKYWRGKFKAWRDKMINTTLTPNPTNFMDIIELSKLVKE